jgi:hypothetical protein
MTGDIVCVLFGGKTPCCLRQADDRYILVGECYVHGLVNGEAIQFMDKGALNEKVLYPIWSTAETLVVVVTSSEDYGLFNFVLQAIRLGHSDEVILLGNE